MKVRLYKTIKNVIIVVVITMIFNFFNIHAYGYENVGEEIKEILDKYYIEDVPQDVMDENNSNDIIDNLKDPYTQIVDINAYNKYLERAYFGIGIIIEMTQDGAQVNTVLVNSPAMKSGLMAGDIIAAADDTYLSGLSIGNALNILNGNVGVRCKLKVLRRNEILNIEVTPAKVYYPTVSSKIIDNSMAYINITSFGENTLEEFKYIMNSLNVDKIDSYIIDLQNNPGGYIYGAIEIAGYFVKHNTVAIAKNKAGIEYELNAVEDYKTIDKPTVFLVNKYTASAAELLTACVKDYNKAIIIGETTFGKGLAQSTFTLSDGSILKTTTLKLYTPKGKEINRVGISPDIHINGVDSLIVGELLLESEDKPTGNNNTVKLVINNKNYYINIEEINKKGYWEAFRQIISKSISIEGAIDSYLAGSNKLTNKYPVVKYYEVPRTEYKVGERVSFKLNAPNFSGNVQYRAMLWNSTTKKYVDLWKTKDLYYDKWRPKGKDVFTISFPISKAGDYKIKVFVKRSGIVNAKAALKGMNCDSYVYEIPFKVIGM